MSKSKFWINAKTAKLGSIDTESGVVTLSDFKPSVELEFRHEDEPMEPISLPAEMPTFVFTGTMTTEQVEYFRETFLEPRLIVKLATKKGDLYAPVKSYENNTITLDIPEDEAEMWQQSEYWKAKLEAQEKRGE